MAVLLSGIACSEQQSSSISDSIIALASDTLYINEAGGEYDMAYNIKNPSPERILSVKTEAEWIHDFDYSKNNILKFHADTNSSSDYRYAVLDIYYSTNEPIASFVVSQSVHPDALMPFSITFDEVTDTKIVYNITPRDKEMTYVVSQITKKMYDEQMKNDDVFFEKLLELLMSNADKYGMTLEDFLYESGQLRTGDLKSMQITNLRPETEYYIIAVGMTSDGKQLTKPYKKSATTTEIQKTDIQFDIQYLVDGPFVTMSVTPTDNAQPYFYNAIPKADFEKTGKTIEQLAQEFIDDLVFRYGILYQLSKEEVISKLVTKGADSDKFEVFAETEYIGYAHTLTADGIINSDVTTKNFTSGSVSPSDNVISISVDGINVDRADIHVSTTNNDPYVIIVDPVSNWNGKTHEEIFNELQRNIPLGNFTRKGDLNQTATKLGYDTEHYVIAFGYLGGTMTTDMILYQFRTAAPGNSENMEFEFTVSDISQTTAKVQVKGTPETSLYFWDVAMASQSEESIKNSINAMIDKYIALGYFRTRAEFMNAMGSRDAVSADIKGMASGTSHKVYAVGVDTYTGEFVSDFHFSEPFKTKEAEKGNVTISLSCGKYFDGNAVMQEYPQYSNAADLAILKVNATTEGNVSRYFYHVFTGDYTDPEAYSDGLLVNNLTNKHPDTVPEREIFCQYDTDLTLLGVAIDLKGNCGPVFRKKFVLTKEGASPISQFNPLKTKNACPYSVTPEYPTLYMDFNLTAPNINKPDRTSTNAYMGIDSSEYYSILPFTRYMNIIPLKNKF